MALPTGLAAGAHLLTAAAWDDDGLRATSVAVHVEILADLDHDGDPDVTDPDDDGDGLPDSYEQEHFGNTTNGVASDDSDDDGFNNLSEYIADTVPTNRYSYFHALAPPAGSWGSLVVNTSLGRLYTLQGCDDLMAENTWSNVASQVDVPGTGSQLTLTDPDPKSNGFYRLRVVYP